MRHFSGVASVSWICLCAAISSQATDATSFQDWQFPNGANPAMPTVVTNTAGSPTAAFVVSPSAAGWVPSLLGFGTDFWDLGAQNPDDPTNGTQGRILLTVPDPVPPTGGSYTDLKLRIVQFVDSGGIYDGNLTFSLTGAIFITRTVVEPTALGKWVEDQYQWHLEPAPAPVSLTITGAMYGTLLDRIRIDTLTPPAPAQGPVISSVVASNQVLVITWAGGLPPYQVYVTSNLLNSTSWQPVGTPTSGTNAQILINLPTAYVRVGGSSQ